MNVDVGKRDGLISVSLAYKDHDEASKVVDNIIESYKAFKSKQRRDMASGILALLGKDKDKTDADLAAKLDEVLHFKQENNTFSFNDDKSNYVVQRTNSLSDELTSEDIETINLKTSFDAAYKSIKGDDDAIKNLDKDGGVILSAQDEELLRAELFTRKQELAGASAFLCPIIRSSRRWKRTSSSSIFRM